MRLYPIEVVEQVKDWSKVVADIEPIGDGFRLLIGERVVARCGNPRALSDWALDKGAREVRFDFDLKILEVR